MRDSGIFTVRYNAYHECVESLAEAQDWPDVVSLADEAARWCDSQPYDVGHTGAQHFRQVKQAASDSLEEDKGDKVSRWAELAKDLAKSDDEVYLRAKIDELRQITEKGEVILEGIANAIRPIGHNLMRLRGIAD